MLHSTKIGPQGKVSNSYQCNPAHVQTVHTCTYTAGLWQPSLRYESLVQTELYIQKTKHQDYQLISYSSHLQQYTTTCTYTVYMCQLKPGAEKLTQNTKTKAESEPNHTQVWHCIQLTCSYMHVVPNRPFAVYTCTCNIQNFNIGTCIYTFQTIGPSHIVNSVFFAICLCCSVLYTVSLQIQFL